MTDGRSTPQDLLEFLRARLPEYDRDELPSPCPVSPTPGGAGSVAEMVAWASIRRTFNSTVEKVSCPVPGDLVKPGLGMREADWEREAARADVNFLYPYENPRAASVFGTQEVLRTGDETTKNATTGGLVGFGRNPDLAVTAGKRCSRGASLSGLVFESLLTRVGSIHLFGFPIRKPANLILAYASVPGRTTGRLIQARGWLIQPRPTGRDELTE